MQLRDALRAAVAGSALEARLEVHAQDLFERHGSTSPPWLEDAVRVGGLARSVAANRAAGRLLATRPALLARFEDLDEGALARRTETLLAGDAHDLDDLEGFLDALRIRRREETLLAAALDLSGRVPFGDVSRFLSTLAEATVRDALAAALNAVRGSALTVVAMGKLGGREFSYESDLDLIFLFDGPTEQMDGASRVGQRLISYVSTMTGAGVAYAVDARLRPSGQQGTLVTSFSSFVEYQRVRAQTWEHLALIRARVIAGAADGDAAAVEAVRAQVASASPPAWEEVATMRERIERERADGPPDRIGLKTGAGGIMDVEFIAEGAVLERCPDMVWPAVPDVPSLLRAACDSAEVGALIDDYHFLRHVEARARWLVGRPIETLKRSHADLPVLAELVEADLPPESLLDQLDRSMRAIRARFTRVIDAGTIDALA